MTTLERLAFNRIKRERFPNLRRKGFVAAVRTALKDEPELQGEGIYVGLLPDGWYQIARAFVVIEIQDSNPLSLDKLQRYCDLWDALDYYDFYLLLYVFDRYGHNERLIDLPQIYFDQIFEETKHERATRGPPTIPDNQASKTETTDAATIKARREWD